MNGVAHVKNKETLSRWHLVFCSNKEAFPNPHIIGTNTSLSPLLDQNPELKRCIVEHAKQKLNDLSAKIIYAYLHKVALPGVGRISRTIWRTFECRRKSKNAFCAK
jgi:hypothetical protein